MKYISIKNILKVEISLSFFFKLCPQNLGHVLYLQHISSQTSQHFKCSVSTGGQWPPQLAAQACLDSSERQRGSSPNTGGPFKLQHLGLMMYFNNILPCKLSFFHKYFPRYNKMRGNLLCNVKQYKKCGLQTK